MSLIKPPSYPALHTIYERSEKAQIPCNYFPIAYEFAEEFFTSPQQKEFRALINKQAQREMVYAFATQEAVLAEIRAFRVALGPYATSSDLRLLLQDHDELEVGFPSAIDKIVLYIELLSEIERVVMAENLGLTMLENSRKLETIRREVLLPAMDRIDPLLEIIYRKERNSIYHSLRSLRKIYYAYDYMRRLERQITLINAKRYHSAKQFKEEAENFAQVLELRSAQEAADLGFDIEEFRIHLHRIVTTPRPPDLLHSADSEHNLRLTVTPEGPIRYEFKDVTTRRETATMTIRYLNATIELLGNEATVINKLISMKDMRSSWKKLALVTKPRKQNDNDTIKEESDEVRKKRVDHACVGAMAKIANKLHLPHFIGSDDGYRFIRPPYSSYLRACSSPSTSKNSEDFPWK